MNKSDFLKYISIDNYGNYKRRKSHIKNIAPKILIEINNWIKKFNIEPINFNDSLKYWELSVTQQKYCGICKKNISINSEYCSNKCRKDDIQNIIKKTQNTLKSKYGSSSPLAKPGAKEKFKETCLKNFGSNHPFKNKDIKEKSKQTLLDNFGVSNPSLSSVIKSKISKKVKLAYLKDGDKILEKRKKTNLKKYGEETILPSIIIKKIKKTLQEKYETSNPFSIYPNTYQLAGKGSINFYNDPIKKKEAIFKRINTIISKYGSIEEMNKKVFHKKKELIIQNLYKDGIKNTIIEYSYNKLGFIKCKCEKGHEYETSFKLLRDRNNRNDICCTICSPPINRYSSNAEIEIYNWLSTYIECQRNVKTLINGEIDIFIPSKNIGIEFNGIYWHSDLYKDKNYHLNKTLLCKNENIDLIHIWEDQWNEKKYIIKERILSKLQINQKFIGARKCKIKEINSKDAINFVNTNHLQGFIPASHHYILIYENEIVFYISVSKRKIGKSKSNSFEILRSCPKLGYNIQGGFSKLFKYIKNELEGNWITYSDLCWGEGNVYLKGGFTLEKYSKPSYWYFVKNQRYHRYSFRKQELIKQGYDSNKTEFQIMDDIGALRVYDCGNAVWKL